MLMRKLIAAAALLAVPSLAFAAPWEVDKMHSSINFSVKHWAVSTVHGTFDTIKSASVSWDKPDFSDAQVEIVVDATSVNTRQPKRDAHLKSPDFFDVAKFPTLSFKSKKVTKAPTAGHLAVVGDLTMHGVTKEVTFDVTAPSEVTAMGVTKAGADATATINRKDFGIVWNEALGAGNLALSNDVKIEIDLELSKKALKAEK
jgi:polyisoprenoid-binding protein YceI